MKPRPSLLQAWKSRRERSGDKLNFYYREPSRVVESSGLARQAGASSARPQDVGRGDFSTFSVTSFASLFLRNDFVAKIPVV